MLIFALVNAPSLREQVALVADELGYDIRWDLPLQGVVATVADTRPAALVVDLADETTHWPDVVWALKTNPATRRIAIVGFALALSDDLRQRADGLLLDEVLDLQDMTDSELQYSLKAHIAASARQTDVDLQAQLLLQINQPPPTLVLKGLHEFNTQAYFEAHETLEHAWMEEPGPIRNLYRGILQIAVAYYHILRGNQRGALKMFLRSVQWLEPLPDICCGINVAQLRQDAQVARQQLEELGPDRMADYDTSLLKPIEFDHTFGYGA